jgi:hypothetical protein
MCIHFEAPSSLALHKRKRKGNPRKNPFISWNCPTPQYNSTAALNSGSNSVICGCPEKVKTSIPEAERVYCFLVFSPSEGPVEREPVGGDHFWKGSYPCLEGWSPKEGN